ILKSSISTSCSRVPASMRCSKGMSNDPAPRSRPVRIVSWHVNGLRSSGARDAFPRFLSESAADVIGVQEVRALPAQLDAALREPPGWHAYFVPRGPGYSGGAIYSRAAPAGVTEA